MPYVKSHKRKLKSGKVTHVEPHWREKQIGSYLRARRELQKVGKKIVSTAYDKMADIDIALDHNIREIKDVARFYEDKGEKQNAKPYKKLLKEMRKDKKYHAKLAAKLANIKRSV
jgi:rubrerythrin